MDQSIIVDALTAHSSPTVSGSKRGWIIYENDMPYIAARLGRYVEAHKFSGLITYLNRLYD